MQPGRDMAQELAEKKSDAGETETYPNYRVVLHNDERNSFDHVAKCLTRHIPGMSSDKAWNLTVKAHNEGRAIVWSGPKEVAEMYYEQLKSDGLSISLEPDV